MFFDSLTTFKLITENWLLIELSMSRQFYENRKISDVLWVPENQNLVDALTKSINKGDSALQMVMAHSHLSRTPRLSINSSLQQTQTKELSNTKLKKKCLYHKHLVCRVSFRKWHISRIRRWRAEPISIRVVRYSLHSPLYFLYDINRYASAVKCKGIGGGAETNEYKTLRAELLVSNERKAPDILCTDTQTTWYPCGRTASLIYIENLATLMSYWLSQ